MPNWPALDPISGPVQASDWTVQTLYHAICTMSECKLPLWYTFGGVPHICTEYCRTRKIFWPNLKAIMARAWTALQSVPIFDSPLQLVTKLWSPQNLSDISQWQCDNVTLTCDMSEYWGGYNFATNYSGESRIGTDWRAIQALAMIAFKFGQNNFVVQQYSVQIYGTPRNCTITAI